MERDDAGASRAPISHEATTGEAHRPTPDDAPEPGILKSCWRSASSGVRRSSRVIGTVVLLALLPGLALSAVGLGAGRGWPIDRARGLPPILLGPVAFYLGCLVCGGFLGALRGLTGALYRRAVSPRRRDRWATMLGRSFPSVRWAFRLLGSIGTRPPRRWLRRGVWAVVGLVVVWYFATGISLGRQVARRLHEAVSTAERDDPFWRLDDLLAHRAPVPDAENSAIVVANALRTLPRSWPALPSIPYKPSRGPTRFEQTLGKLAKMAENLRLEDEAAGAIRDEMAARAEAVRLCRTVADYRLARHALMIGEAVFDTPLPETQAARTAEKLLQADAAIRVHDGDADGALDSCRAILGVSRSIGDEPFLISQIVRAAIGLKAMRSTCRVLGQGEPSDAALARLQAAVLEERDQPLILVGLKGERAMLDELLRRLADGTLAPSRLSGAGFVNVVGRSDNGPTSCQRLVFAHQRAIAIAWMNQAVDIARQPVAQRPLLWRTWEAGFDRALRTEWTFLPDSLPLGLIPMITYPDLLFTRYQAELGAMVLLLAAERHRLKTGDWPASIAAIDPHILANAPTDPFTGEAYQILRHDGQLRVYSPGPDLNDEGGAFDTRSRMPYEGPGPDDVGVRAWDVPLRRGEPES